MIAFCLSAALTVALQNPPPPPTPAAPTRAPRDPLAATKGTSIIKGRVLTSDGRPLRRAQIRVTSAALSDPQTTTTGIDGEFELRELPAGRYTVQATRSGYLAANHGQAAFGEPGRPIEVADGAAIERVEFVLERAGVISGRVTDEMGEAAAGVDIWVMQHQFYRGRRRVVPIAAGLTIHVSTDDSGQYRFSGLPPGGYLIMGRLRDTWMSEEKDPQMLSYAPTYFPGTADAAEARRVKIASGQESAAVDFTLVAVRASMIAGTAVASNGTLITSGRVTLAQELMGPNGGTMSVYGSSSIGADGSWQLRDVPPGEYILRATGNSADGGQETVALPVVITGVDLDGVVLSTDAGTVVSGRVVTDSGERLPAGASLRVMTTPVSMDSEANRFAAGKDDGTVGADGGFARKTLSGPAILRVVGLPQGWAVKNVQIGGRDYAGLPIELRQGQPLANVMVVVTNAFPTLTGKLLGADAKARDATVLLFPADPARWAEAAANVRSARGDQSGSYRFESVRPGEYFVIALSSMARWQINDPDFLIEQQARAQKIVIGASASDSLDLKVVRR